MLPEGEYMDAYNRVLELEERCGTAAIGREYRIRPIAHLGEEYTAHIPPSQAFLAPVGFYP